MKTLMIILISVASSMALMYFFMMKHTKEFHCTKYKRKKILNVQLSTQATNGGQTPPKTVGEFLEDAGITI